MDLSGLHNLKRSGDRQAKARNRHMMRNPKIEMRPADENHTNLVDAWRDLAAHATEPNIFYEHWFLRPALQELNGNPELRLFLLWSGPHGHSQLLGLLPVGPMKTFGRWPVPHIQNWMHHNCFLGTPLVRRGFEKEFWAALCAELDQGAWPGFFHINGLTIGGELDQTMRAVCADQNRRCDLVHSEARALLQSDLDPDSYYQATVRSKKRKELRRQSKRLSELGDLAFNHRRDGAGLDQWAEDFLNLERSGWKGQNGSALDSAEETGTFFKQILAGAAKACQLERHDLFLDGKPLAMLVNFLSSPGSFSFKTAFDEQYARYSPGVLLQLENLKILQKPAIQWMDSCAAEDHPMIDSLWSGRRHIGRFSIELAGFSRKTTFRGVRMGEDLMAHLKGREIVDVLQEQK